MPRDGSSTPADLLGRIDMIRVECTKCDRRGRYRVRTLIRAIGVDGKLTDWLSRLTADCPRRKAARFSDLCAAQCPEMVALFGSDP